MCDTLGQITVGSDCLTCLSACWSTFVHPWPHLFYGHVSIHFREQPYFQALGVSTLPSPCNHHIPAQGYGEGCSTMHHSLRRNKTTMCACGWSLFILNAHRSWRWHSYMLRLFSQNMILILIIKNIASSGLGVWVRSLLLWSWLWH